MEKSSLKSVEGSNTGTELESQLMILLNSPGMLKEFFIAQGLPWKEDDEEPKLEIGTKSEPTSPTSCSQSSWQLGEDIINVGFPDLKLVYQKTQSRANRQSRQRVEHGKIKIRVSTGHGGPQVQTIEVYVERTPDAAVLVGDKCGRVCLKPHPGKYLPHQYFFAVDLDSIYESPTKRGVPVYKLSTVDAHRRNKFRLVVVVVLIDDTRSKEFISPSFRLRSKTGMTVLHDQNTTNLVSLFQVFRKGGTKDMQQC